MESEGRPDYYKPVLVKYTDANSNLLVTCASMVSDGDSYYWIMNGTDYVILDADIHLWREI